MLLQLLLLPCKAAATVVVLAFDCYASAGDAELLAVVLPPKKC
jgi:hypothetical protein